ncbi:MAG: DUF3649 domain-containing protein [Acidobacteria bacterium]|nr:DUF3649 domain-containing protein [Acidobacteriota bacterium]
MRRSTSKGSHVLSRVLAAVVGGYAAANVVAVGVAQILPMSRGDGVMTGILLACLVYAAAVVWVFAARSARRAWLGILLTTAAFGGLALLGRAGVS